MKLATFLKPTIFPGIRHTSQVDYYEIAAIDRVCFANPWAVDDLTRILKGQYTLSIVAEDRGLIQGYAIYELLPIRVNLLRLAVSPDHRGHGVGTRLIERVKAKLSIGGRLRLKIHVRESNLDAQLFLRSQGFRANKIEHGHFRDTKEDAYVMTYSIDRGDIQ